MVKLIYKRSQQFFEKYNRPLNEGIVFLAILQMILASAIPSLEFFQVPVEILLIMLLLMGCLIFGLNMYERLLVASLFVVTIFSYWTLNLPSFIVVTKNHMLGVLSILYFSKILFNSIVLKITLLIHIFLLSLFYIIPQWVLPLSDLAANKEYNISRFGGLFLNGHFSSYILAILLIYLTCQKKIYGLISLVVLRISGSSTILAAYIGQVAWIYIRKYGNKINILENIYFITIFIIVTIYFFYNYYVPFYNLIEYYSDRDGNRFNSILTMMAQLGQANYWEQLFHIFPSMPHFFDVTSYTKFQPKIGDFPHDGANEIGYFSFATQSGLLFGSIYLFSIINNAKFYTLFIILSLVHFNFIFTPVGIFMMIQYSKRLNAN